MEIMIKNKDIILRDQPDFVPAHIFDCGQCFRFNRQKDGSYIGTARGRTIKISQCADSVILHGTSLTEFKNIWYSFFDLGRDYGAVKRELTRSGDPVMRQAAAYGSGIRILDQELWETLVSFIISASNNIPRIKQIIERLCTCFGDAHEYLGNTYYAFPSPERIAQLTPEELSVIRAGFRDKYILSCARDVASGRIDLESIAALPTPDAKKALMNIYGVGNKVSDCILLFGLNRWDAFPVDVWIKRIMEYCYFSNKPQTIRTISEYAEKKFGGLGGIAQQYLFFYARELKIGAAV